MRFDSLKFLRSAVRKLSGTDGRWDCQAKGHFGDPESVGKHIASHDFDSGHLRFIVTCKMCKRQTGYDCERGPKGEIFKSEYDLENPNSKREYFAELKENKSQFELAESCFCGRDAIEADRLCASHFIELTLRGIFQKMDKESFVSQSEKGALSRVANPAVEREIVALGDRLKPQDLTDFTLAWIEFVQKVKAVNPRS